VILREPTKRGDKAKITFVVPNDEECGDVFVVGDFNFWNPGATILRRRGAVRRVSLTLSTGRRYAFRYYCDGRWFNDDDADGWDLNEYGGKNSILSI
jgi:hypothetical protein